MYSIQKSLRKITIKRPTLGTQLSEYIILKKRERILLFSYWLDLILYLWPTIYNCISLTPNNKHYFSSKNTANVGERLPIQNCNWLSQTDVKYNSWQSVASTPFYWSIQWCNIRQQRSQLSENRTTVHTHHRLHLISILIEENSEVCTKYWMEWTWIATSTLISWGES